MSLQARFAALLSLLGAAVIVNLAVSVWSVGLLDREQQWANEQIGTVLGPLHAINRSVWNQARELGSPGIGRFEGPSAEPTYPPPSPEDHARFVTLSREALEQVAELEGSTSSALRSGVNTTRNLRERLRRATVAAFEWFASADGSARDRALRELYELHELIERLEARLIDDAAFAKPYVRNVRNRLISTVVASVVIVVLLLLLGERLFRRWVIQRTEQLRFAAERLGAGDFEHRIPIQGTDEIDRVAARVNEMAGTILTMQAERIERERLAAIGELARSVAHNIRNPLAGIRSLAELSALELAPGSPVAEHQQRIIRTVDRFGSWLTEFLSVSTPLEVTPVEAEVRPWVEGLVEALRPMAEGRAVELRLDAAGAPKVAVLDRRHMEQALLGVVTNAIEISPRGGVVSIRIGPAGPGRWGIHVTDDGPGLAPGAADRIFRPYFTTKKGGTGIGLAIAHRVVREHGGRIEAENRSNDPPGPNGLGPGAIFRIELPLVLADQSARIGQE